MPDVQSTLEFLANIPLYQQEKPYFVLPLAGSTIDPDKDPVTNIKLVPEELTIYDIRQQGQEFSIGTNGFQIIKHRTQALPVNNIESLKSYKTETEDMLKGLYPDAECVHTWDFRERWNTTFQRTNFDMNDPLLIEGPAKGAHDATFDSGPDIIRRHLTVEEKDQYIRPGFRFRLINTWRSLIEKLEDRPLAVCDFQSVDPEDLVPMDRVYPQRVGEVYSLHHNKSQRWYWLSDQTTEEVFVTIMYDSVAGSHARYCPHVSFHNPLASPDAEARRSIETRTIVITKI